MASLFDQLQQQGKSRGEKIAVVHCQGGGRVARVTFAELAEMAGRFATALAGAPHASPSVENSIVPLFMAKSPTCVAAMIGAIGAGKAFACLNRKLRPPQINAILSAIGPGIAITDSAGAKALAPGRTPDSPIARMNWIDDVPAPSPGTPGKGRGGGSRRDFGGCLFTSGSTGNPKGVLIAESDLRARAAAEIECFGITPDDVLLNVLPFSFDVGLNQLLTSILAGCSIVLLDSWLPVDILRAAAEFNVTGISGVPAIWADMLKAGMTFDRSGPHRALRYITVSGGDMPLAQLDRLPELIGGAGIFKTYGQTEAFRAAALRPEEFAAKTTSVGKPFGGAQIHLLREDGTPCKADEEGEIVHIGLGIMLGYLDGQDPQNKIRPNPFRRTANDPPIAIFTGDIGHFDADGYLYVKGRRDAMLKVAGNRVYPAEIVAQLSSIEGIAEAEVVGVKGETGETNLVAFVILAPNSNQTGADIRRTLNNRVPSYMVPREVVILPAMPRTASGKPDRPALLDRAAALLQGGA